MKSALTLLALFVTACASSAADRYVAPNGKDTNVGSINAPWKTIQKAANSAKAGDTVHIRAGNYKEKVQVNVSGTVGKQITFKSYNSENVTLDMDGITPGNDLTAVIRIPSRSYVTVQGLNIKNFRTSDEARVPCGILVDGSGVGVKIVGNKISYIEQNNSVKGNWDANAHGIAVYGTKSSAIKDLVIEGNELSKLRLGASEALVINGNVDGFTVRKNKVHDCNNIGIDVIGFEGTGPTASVDRARNGKVAENIVYNINSAYNPAYDGHLTKGGGYRAAAGIYVDGGTETVIECNQVYGCNFGIELASENKGKRTDKITVRNNLLRHNHGAGIIMGGYDEQRGSTENCTIVNNTLYQNDTSVSGGGQIQLQFYVSNNTVKNNILWANAKTQQMIVHSPESDAASSAQKELSTSNVFSNNLYYAAGGSTSTATFVVFSGGKSKTLKGISAWQNSGKSAGDAGSNFANPKFATATPSATSAMTSYKLTASSPAINTGAANHVVGTSEMDVFGEARLKGGRVDRGADEF